MGRDFPLSMFVELETCGNRGRAIRNGLVVELHLHAMSFLENHREPVELGVVVVDDLLECIASRVTHRLREASVNDPLRKLEGLLHTD